MPRGEIYRAVKGAFVYLYLYLVILGLTALAAALWEEGTARLLLALVAADFAAALLAKRKLILDLLEGRTETFRGRIHHRENAGSLRSVSVIYLVEDGNESPRRFVCFPDTVPVSLEKMRELSSGSAVLWYLPRSLAVVGVEGSGKETAEAPRPRTREWYRQKPWREEEYRRLSYVAPCRRLREHYWFCEMVSTCLFLTLAGMYALYHLC